MSDKDQMWRLRRVYLNHHDTCSACHEAQGPTCPKGQELWEQYVTASIRALEGTEYE